MMPPELSRRLAKVMNTSPFVPPQMSLEDRASFVRDAENCETFKDLPEKWKKKVLAGEKELKAQATKTKEGAVNEPRQIGRKITI